MFTMSSPSFPVKRLLTAVLLGFTALSAAHAAQWNYRVYSKGLRPPPVAPSNPTTPAEPGTTVVRIIGSPVVLNTALVDRMGIFTRNTATVSVFNDGVEPLTISKLTVLDNATQAPSSVFAANGCTGTPVPPGASCDISVTMTPAALGPVEPSTLTVTTNDKTGSHAIPLSGTLAGNGGFSLSSFTPTSIQLASQATIAIIGAGFSPDRTTVTFTREGSPDAPLQGTVTGVSSDGKTLSVIAPDFSALGGGNYKVKVEVPYRAPITSSSTLRVNAPPTSGEVTELAVGIVPSGMGIGGFAIQGNNFVVAYGKSTAGSCAAADSRIDKYTLTASGAQLVSSTTFSNASLGGMGKYGLMLSPTGEVYARGINYCSQSPGIRRFDLTTGTFTNVGTVAPKAFTLITDGTFGYAVIGLATTGSPSQVVKWRLNQDTTTTAIGPTLPASAGAQAFGPDGLLYTLAYDASVSTQNYFRGMDPATGATGNNLYYASGSNIGVATLGYGIEDDGSVLFMNGQVLYRGAFSGSGYDSARINLKMNGTTYSLNELWGGTYVNGAWHTVIQQVAGGPIKLIRVN
jgi:hypothetical protein